MSYRCTRRNKRKGLKKHIKGQKRKQGGTCRRKIAHPSGKEAHAAKRLLEERGETGLEVYKCRFCGKYHVGHSD